MTNRARRRAMLSTFARGWGVLTLVGVLCSGVACSDPRSGESAAAPVASLQPGTPEPAPTGAEPLPTLENGVDVSWHSGTVDWTRVEASGLSFAIVKASEGVDLPDPSFAEHWSSLAGTSLVRGAYHFYVTEDDPDAQADLFTKTVELRSGDLAPIVDVETLGKATKPGLADRLQRFLDRLESHYGAPPILYTSPTFWDTHLTDAFGRYPLWVAEYDVDAPTLPTGWSEWALWQWKGDAAVDGVEKSADLSRANGPLSGNDLRIP